MSEVSGETSSNAARVTRYLRGDTLVLREVGGWIRSALRARYSSLAQEHDDLAQIVHTKLLASLRAGKYAEARSFRAYITGVVHHVAIDRLREVYRTRLADEELASQSSHEPIHDPYGSLHSVGERALLHQAVLAVPQPCRELWHLMFVEHLTYEEIGRRLGIPAGTVKSRMWHCRRKALTALNRLRASASNRPLRS